MTSRKSTSGTKTRQKKSKKQAQAAGFRLRPFLFKLVFTALVALAGYLLYLDSMVTDTFEGERWHTPARIFARPMTLSVGSRLSLQEVESELGLKDYRKVRRLIGPGQYASSSSRIEVWFSAADRQASGLTRVMLTFDGIRLARITSQESPVLRNISLAPEEIDQITSSRKRDRQPVVLDDVPETLISALLLVEDRSFFQHAGVAPSAIARAFVANIRAGRAVQGGSTLTQQLAKNLFLTRERSLTRKAKEALLALIMDFRYSKERLLETYLNEIYLGQNGAVAVHGFGAASKFYFGLPLNQTSIEQQAMLVAMVKGPSLYNPWKRPEKVRERRDMVLRLLVSDNLISRTDYEYSVSETVRVQPKAKVRMQNRPAIVDLIRSELAMQRGLGKVPENLSLYTSISPVAQSALESAVTSTLQQIETRHHITGLQTGAVVLDAVSGQVRALVGERNFSYAGFNRALNARRPIGSLIKPFIVLAALESDRYHLASMLNDRPVSLRDVNGKRWQPQNYSRQFHGSVPMQDALQESLNVPFVNLGMSLGLEKIADVLQRAGIRIQGGLYPSLLLGSISLSPLQVAQLYSTLADGSVTGSTTIIDRAVANHEEVFSNAHRPADVRFDSTDIFLTNYALARVPRYGTAKRLGRVFPRVNLAGKTGTTNDLRDSWYVGFDERELVVIWIGRDDNQPTGLTGSSGALRIYESYAKQRGLDSIQLPLPADVKQVSFNSAGVAVSADCENIRIFPLQVDMVPPVKQCDGKEPKSEPMPQKPFLQRLFDLF